ncbi:DNA helicase [Campylobacter fetus subsp. testudinum]|uniref:Replicative DNA helicase n=1 Tax=Campylobacter fetus subsp. testudinum TaxID=1507806 RepID=A0AAX0H9M4_CAMFE|nr:replicative DNA helicase [Campylobacter fetus]ALV64990.1 replicative DNA helicase [Campylobacter fetus subsp. testudinum Sp3]AVK81236.1 replicative DNA helicase [Campylobacter fetus subsp. testudinum]EAK0825965.1 replicative DNA helicase [Campylobacter fetus]EAK0829727.1 replicative DNA helicase [Campylobacter fetus]MPB71590.1 replicative DNA helicase [Campylobacter fetus]
MAEVIGQNLYDLDMERSILSAILFSEDNLGEIYDLINPSDFYLKGHADVYAAMIECLNHDEPVDMAFVKKRLANNFDDTVFTEIITTNSILDIKKYATELKEKSIKRSLINVAHKIPNKVNEDKASRDMVDDISGEIYSLVDNSNNGIIKESKEIITDVVKELEKQKNLIDRDIVGIDTGFKVLNEKTKGFKDGDLVIIAARPGMGKTTFVLNLVQKVLNQDLGVVFFSLEMPATQLMLRLLSAKTSIPLQNLMTADIDNDEITRLSDACDEMSRKKLFVYDSGNATIHQVRTQMRKLKTSHPEIKLCVIDYIGLMTNSSAYTDRHLQIAEISRGLKLLARELNLPVIALSQLNRSLEARANKRPMLSDLRESGAIEQDADTILFVYRNDVYLEQEEKEREQKAKLDGKEYARKFVPNKIEENAEIIIGKNRNGPTGTVDVVFQKEFTRFVDKSFSAPSMSVEFSG